MNESSYNNYKLDLGNEEGDTLRRETDLQTGNQITRFYTHTKTDELRNKRTEGGRRD